MLEDCISPASLSDSINHNYAKRAVTSFLKSCPCTTYVILACDINIDFLTLTNVQLYNCLSLFNLTNVIKEPTRITPNSSTLIDPIILSDTCIILDFVTISVESEISDHKATYVCLQIPICLSQCYYYRDVWNYKNANYNHSNDLIRQQAEINETLTANESCKKIHKNIPPVL